MPEPASLAHSGRKPAASMLAVMYYGLRFDARLSSQTEQSEGSSEYPQAMCTTIVQSTVNTWVTSSPLKTVFVAVDKIPHLYTWFATSVHHLTHSIRFSFSSVIRPVVHIVHSAYKVLITNKFKLINRYISGELL